MGPVFTPEKFEEMIARRGHPVNWERGARCPCQDPDRFAPEETCPLCNGKGYLYTDQGEFTATVLSITGNHKYAVFGDWIAGDCIMTYPAAYDVGERDRITLTHAEERESDILRRGVQDFLTVPTITRIVEVRDETRVYTEGIDFDLVGQNIVWKGAEPVADEAYTVLYWYRPVYVAWLNIPQSRARVRRGDTYKAMPKKVALRRWRDFANPGTAEV